MPPRGGIFRFVAPLNRGALGNVLSLEQTFCRGESEPAARFPCGLIGAIIPRRTEAISAALRQSSLTWLAIVCYGGSSEFQLVQKWVRLPADHGGSGCPDLLQLCGAT